MVVVKSDMVISAVYDREIRDIVGKLLAYQRDSPIHVRIITPIIHDTKLSDGEMLSGKILKLIKFKDAMVTLLVNPRFIKKREEIELLGKFEDMGVKIHLKRDLHAKTILLESRSDKGVLVSSANLTPSGLGSQQEIGVYLLNELVHIYERVYDYTTRLLSETNISIRGGDYRANLV